VTSRTGQTACVALVLVTMMAVALGCGTGASSTTLSLTLKRYSDPGKPVEATTGEVFRIILEANPSTGYSWSMTGDAQPTLKLIKSGFSSSESARKAGSPTSEYWEFEAMSSGTAKVSFSYVRPWEKDTPPVKTETFTINVK
jgi:predicted secreted protein